MRKLPLLGAALATLLTTPAEASDSGWDTASRVGEVALVTTALSVPALKSDMPGILQAGGSIGAAALVTEGLKQAFPEERPDGSGRHSFPSMHTSVSFASAATLQNRYGWRIGLPATLVATFVGVARVEARKHHWYDVVAGAAIGEASGWLITRKHDPSVQLFPWGDSKGGGITMAMRF
jgi:membrane-associated phospholipid phosphatase